MAAHSRQPFIGAAIPSSPAGRREDRLKAICARHAGMAYFVLDATDFNSIRSVAHKVTSDFPALNCVLNNAGVQMRAGISADGALDEQSLEAKITTNLFGPIRVAAALLPHLPTRGRTKGPTSETRDLRPENPPRFPL